MNPNANIGWVGQPKRENYEEHHQYHRKRINVDFKLEGDSNEYNLEVQNIHFENGQRKYFYTIYVLTNEDGSEYNKETEYAHLEKPIPLMEELLQYPNVRMLNDWVHIDKDPNKIGHDGLFKE